MHLWIGLVLGILIVPIAISGALLVFQDELDALLHPARYAATGAATQPASTYFDAARGALRSGPAPTAVRFPADGGPVVVSARGRTAEGRPQVFNVYLDPPTGRVLDVADFRASPFGFLHIFRREPDDPADSGCAVVGWVGVAMLISSLSGIYLWWPRGGGFRRGLRWRRSNSGTPICTTCSAWISLPLAVVSATGIYLGFPQQSRTLLSSLTPVSPRPAFGAPCASTHRARTLRSPGRWRAKPAPSRSRCSRPPPPRAWDRTRRRCGGSSIALPIPRGSPRWSMTAAAPSSVRRRRGRPHRRMDPLDPRGQPFRVDLEGRGAAVRRVSAIFVVTGVTMWLRRSSVKRMRQQAAAKLSPAE